MDPWIQVPTTLLTQVYVVATLKSLGVVGAMLLGRLYRRGIVYEISWLEKRPHFHYFLM